MISAIFALLDPLEWEEKKCMHSHKPRQANLGVFGEKTGGWESPRFFCKAYVPGIPVYREMGNPVWIRSHPLIVIFRLCDTCNPNDDLFITRFVRSET